MRTVLVISLSLVFAACGGGSDYSESAYDPASDNHGYGWEFHAQGPRGLRMRYATGQAAINPAVYEALFDEVQRCTGLSAPMPFVIFVNGGINGLGLYYTGPSLIVMASRGWSAFQHESVHNVLDHATGDPDGEHRSSFFTDCTGAQEPGLDSMPGANA